MSVNPNIKYRFGVGDTVEWVSGQGKRIVGKVVKLCFCDESYDIDNGWTCPGYSMKLVQRTTAETLGEIRHLASSNPSNNLRIVLREHARGMSKTLFEKRDGKWVSLSHTERRFEETS